ncbi:nucleoside deaminase [Nocardia aurea]|uniref:Nucleoside deaminase n=1 Tax=Nocardia aurea TaxID=2144174 RepID=A0ABV3FKQ2_9NOCA
MESGRGTATELTESDLRHLRRCVELATEAVDAGDHPFGSVLVAADGIVLAEDRNRVVSANDPLRHPEIELARWARDHLGAAERATATVYTSGEHCPMCSTAHALVGLGRIVYAGSSAQLADWLADTEAPRAAFHALPITVVAPGIPVLGPVPEFAETLRELHRRSACRSA